MIFLVFHHLPLCFILFPFSFISFPRLIHRTFFYMKCFLQCEVFLLFLCISTNFLHLLFPLSWFIPSFFLFFSFLLSIPLLSSLSSTCAISSPFSSPLPSPLLSPLQGTRGYGPPSSLPFYSPHSIPHLFHPFSPSLSALSFPSLPSPLPLASDKVMTQMLSVHLACEAPSVWLADWSAP